MNTTPKWMLLAVALAACGSGTGGRGTAVSAPGDLGRSPDARIGDARALAQDAGPNDARPERDCTNQCACAVCEEFGFTDLGRPADARPPAGDVATPPLDAASPAPDLSGTRPDGALPPAPDAAERDCTNPCACAVCEEWGFPPDLGRPTDALPPAGDVATPPLQDAAILPPAPDAFAGDPSLGRDDEFDDPQTLHRRWLLRHEVENGPAQFAIFDIATTHPGQFTLQPAASGWRNEHSAPYLYQTVRGDISIETSVLAGHVGVPDQTPNLPFNSAGLLARDPVHGPGHDNWVMLDIGYQGNWVGTEAKSTTDSVTASVLARGTHHGRLRLCRVGTTWVLARWLTNDVAWVEVQRYERPDLPDEIQLGLAVNAWNSHNANLNPNVAPDLYAQFDYARFGHPASPDDCLVGP